MFLHFPRKQVLRIFPSPILAIGILHAFCFHPCTSVSGHPGHHIATDPAGPPLDMNLGGAGAMPVSVLDPWGPTQDCNIEGEWFCGTNNYIYIMVRTNVLRGWGYPYNGIFPPEMHFLILGQEGKTHPASFSAFNPCAKESVKQAWVQIQTIPMLNW
jgi:hypothetical protein